MKHSTSAISILSILCILAISYGIFSKEITDTNRDVAIHALWSLTASLLIWMIAVIINYFLMQREVVANEALREALQKIMNRFEEIEKRAMEQQRKRDEVVGKDVGAVLNTLEELKRLKTENLSEREKLKSELRLKFIDSYQKAIDQEEDFYGGKGLKALLEAIK